MLFGTFVPKLKYKQLPGLVGVNEMSRYNGIGHTIYSKLLGPLFLS